jgi:hypothetical protein
MLAGDAGSLEEYKGDPKPLLREFGVQFSEKTEEIFDAVYGDEIPHVVVKGPRGGGKTFIITLALGCRFVLKKDDVFHLAGSEEQAKNGFRYISEFITGQPRFEEFVNDDLKTAATTCWGNWYKIAACSHTRVRGPHAGDPHKAMGYVQHGGVLYTDEEAEIPDDIVDAVRLVTNTANPRKWVRSSTAHKVAGRFAEVSSNPKKYGATLIQYDVLDVNETCTHDCAKCPMGIYFAGALYGSKASRRMVERYGVRFPAVPKRTIEGALAWVAWKEANNFPLHEPAICEGRAKMHRPGHVRMDAIFEDVRQSQSRSSDEVELFGRNRGIGNRVIEGAALERCLVWEPGEEEGEVVAGIDHGWNWMVICLVQVLAGKLRLLDVIYLRHMLMEEIETVLSGLRDEHGLYRITADASHKRENAQMAEWGYEVTEVPFAQYKDSGVRWLKGVFERGQMEVPGRIIEGSGVGEIGRDGRYEFPSQGLRLFFTQAMGWHTGANGKIVKRDDHGPDALITLSRILDVDAGAYEDVEWLGGGMRESLK